MHHSNKQQDEFHYEMPADESDDCGVGGEEDQDDMADQIEDQVAQLEHQKFQLGKKNKFTAEQQFLKHQSASTSAPITNSDALMQKSQEDKASQLEEIDEADGPDQVAVPNYQRPY